MSTTKLAGSLLVVWNTTEGSQLIFLRHALLLSPARTGLSGHATTRVPYSPPFEVFFYVAFLLSSVVCLI